MPQNGRRQGRRNRRTGAFRAARATFTFVVGIAGPIGLAITVHQVYLSKPVADVPQPAVTASPGPVADVTTGLPATSPPAGRETAPDHGGQPAAPAVDGQPADGQPAGGHGELPPAAGRSGSGGTGTDRVAGDEGREPVASVAPTPAPTGAAPSAPPPTADGRAEPCRWKVRWRSAGIYRSRSDPEPVAYARRNQVLTGACWTVTGPSRRTGRETEMYYRVDAGQAPGGAALPAGYVLAESLVTALS
ncbi:hypothetical protein [Catenuloplanes indicus]|uniref:Uncharacterized protein n=1 Tax=Catenuloplanes indicus TaxID=137267 RepID=A0AAE3W7W7_9ACTN|nr:hypothetical protein [Catenuloplanes indicus]MDQ0370304.1 hypothetical protein [Catenuloplanes indicus]